MRNFLVTALLAFIAISGFAIVIGVLACSIIAFLWLQTWKGIILLLWVVILLCLFIAMVCRWQDGDFDEVIDKLRGRDY